jgi:hypothetical protein
MAIMLYQQKQEQDLQSLSNMLCQQNQEQSKQSLYNQACSYLQNAQHAIENANNNTVRFLEYDERNKKGTLQYALNQANAAEMILKHLKEESKKYENSDNTKKLKSQINQSLIDAKKIINSAKEKLTCCGIHCCGMNFKIF